MEKEVASRDEKIMLLNEKVTDMTKNEFMINEQVASLRRDFETTTRKLQEHENRAKKKLEDKEKGMISSESRDVDQGPRKNGLVPRPGSRGNPLAPIKSNALVPVRSPGAVVPAKTE